MRGGKPAVVKEAMRKKNKKRAGGDEPEHGSGGKFVLLKRTTMEKDSASENEMSDTSLRAESLILQWPRMNNNAQAMGTTRENEPNEQQGLSSTMKANTSENPSPTTSLIEMCDLEFTGIQRILEFSHSEECDKATMYALQARLELLESRWKDFEAKYYRSPDEPMGEQGISNQNKCFSTAEEAYLEAKAVLCQKIDAFKTAATERGGLADQNVVRQLGAILSQDKLPIFNGDFTQWASFRDLFRIEVHENSNFTNAQKLKKLLNALDGPARRAIGDWRIGNGEGYEKAWQALCRQYDNDYRTIRAHLRKIHELKPMRAASGEDLSESLYAVRNARRNLQSMLQSESLSDYQFLHQLESILDDDSKREWEMRRDTNILPTLDEMFEFLERRTMFLSSLSGGAGRIATTDQKVAASVESSNRTINNVVNQSFQNRRNNQNIGSRPAKSNWVSTEKCVKCGKNCYALFRCNEFGALTLAERARFVADKNLCRICFSNRHKTETCEKNGCQKSDCGERHNSYLCPLNAKFKTSQSTKKEATSAPAVASVATA